LVLSVAVPTGPSRHKSRKAERGIRQGRCLSPILFNLHSEHLPKKALEGFGDFKIGQVICTVKYKDDIVLLQKEETARMVD
jgi:hypothetical protein